MNDAYLRQFIIQLVMPARC